MKKIYGFKVQINDKSICRAGFDKEDSVVNCSLTSVRRKGDEKEELDISVGGLISETEQYVSWYNNYSLEEGDKISFEVITSDFDAPSSMTKEISEEEQIAHKLKLYKKLKEELKDYLEE